MIRLFIWMVILARWTTSGVDFKRTVGDLEEKLSLSVKEGLPAGSLIGKISKRPGFTYKLNERDPYFNFDPTTGEIKTLVELDRESMPDDRRDLLIVGNSPTYFITVAIKVLDVNDNPPTFPFHFQNVTLPESAKLGSRTVLSNARDYDNGDNGLISQYNIESGNDDHQFKLLSVGGTLQLELLKPLDREIKSVYTLNISASDKGDPPLTGYCTVFINVLDSNDNAPVFDQSQYYSSVTENLPVGASILTVSATDKDVGDNGRVYYKISNDQSNQFRIDINTGAISAIKSDLNCPVRNCKTVRNCTRVCVITVEATDAGVPIQTGRAFVDIELKDENNHQPEILFRYYPPGGDYSSVEDTKPIGSIIAVVTVSDTDVGDNGRTAVSIVSGDDFGHFKLESNDLFSLVRTNATLNRAKISSYNLAIMAHDFGQPPKHTTKILKIFVTDSNDEPPVFDQESYYVKISENSAVSSYVTAVNAVSKSSKIIYNFLSGNELNYFSIDKSTGLITTSSILDYETIKNFTLTISAKESGPALNGSVTRVTVELLDYNDNPPVFERSLYNASIPEDAKVGTVVSTVRAVDRDSGQNAVISFLFANHRNLSETGQFSIDEKSGKIFISSSLDRETTEHYKMQILAIDHGVPSLTSSVDFTVVVEDINDHVPSFYPTDYYVNLRKDDPLGSYVTRIKASDLDAGANGRISYFIQAAPVGAFDLESITGRLTLKRLPFGRNQVDVVLGAKDGAGALSDNNATVHIFVVDNLNIGPKFVKPSFEFSVKEDNLLTDFQSNGKAIGSVSATDFDAQARIKYSLVDGDLYDTFTVGQYSGEIRSVKLLDYEFKSNYDLSVVAIGTRGVSTSIVTIKLEDINDNAPTFKTVHSSVAIDNNHPAGLPIFYAIAEDFDGGLNGVIRYSIDNADIFSIDQSLGAITFKQPAFLLTDKTYHCNIFAHDLGKPSLNNSMSLTIHLNSNHSNSKSLFSSPFLQYDILETAAVNSILFTLNTTELSADNIIIFELLDSYSDDLFGVFPDGKVYVRKKLDYETSRYFDLIVIGIVRDKNGLQYSSTATVYFEIFDTNDNSPKCVNDTFTFYLAEESDPYSYVGTVEATDIDSGLNGLISYRIIENDFDASPFTIDSSSGIIKNLVSFDREKMEKYPGGTPIRVKVETTDHGYPPLTTVCPVDIIITDINDNAPVFALDFYSSKIFENVEINTEILQLSAIDNDDNENAELHFIITDGNDNETFWLNETSGQLFVRKGLDREKVSLYRLTFFVQDSGAPSLNSTAHGSIIVLDINDNAPKFTSEPFPSLKVSESIEIGTVINKLSATDDDLGLAGNVKYYLQTGNVDRSFEINQISGELILIKKLDHESVQNYSLSVVAADEGVPGLSSQIIITVEVVDENDNYPVISATSLLGSVSDNSPIGTPVMTVSASDADSGPNGMIKFSILKQVPNNAFSINAETGVISLETVLHKRKAQTYKLLVEAQDQAFNISQRLSSQKFATILVVNGAYNSTLYEGPRAAAITSSSQTDSLVTLVKPGYQIVGGVDRDLFTISSDGGLYLKQALKVYKPFYKLSLDTKDSKLVRQERAVHSATYNSTVEFIVLSQYDHNGDVTFDRSFYSFEAPANIAVGTEIGRVRANSKAGNRLEYYVTKVQSNTSGLPLLLDVDAYSGSLRVERQLDIDGLITELSMEIYAITAETNQPHSASCQVKIKILNAKDTPPKFSEDFYEFQISEDAPVGTVIGAVSVSNNDSFNLVTFSIDGGQLGTFNINPQTGLITSRYLLDREKNYSYTLTATATNGVYSSAAFIRIEVTDVNDNAPRFTKDQYTFRVFEGAERNSFVGAIEAVDLDSEVNRLVDYKLDSSEISMEFNLDRFTGVITVNGVLDAEVTPFYMITASALDRGNPAKNSKTIIYVEVLDLNDNQPSLIQSVFDMQIFEDISVGTKLVQLEAFDPDTDTEFSYEISMGDSWNQFRIDRTGALYVSKNLDRETRTIHQMQITVYDQPPSKAIRHSCTAEITINLLDINDNAPKILSSNKAFVLENSSLKTLVTTLVGQDDDLSANGMIQFEMDPVHIGVPKFSIDPVSGHVLVNGPLDRETEDTYQVTVFAYDRGDPSLKNYFNLTVQILDDDDNSPRFVENFRELTVSEDLSVGQTLLQLSATDKDINENAALKFWIDSGDFNNDFTLSPDTGMLSVAHPLNYERANGYNLTLAVSNLNKKVNPDKAIVILNVNDINDNAPTFSRNPIYIGVAENFRLLPIIIGRAEAIDPDSGLNGKLSYSITQGNTSLFSVDSLTGDLKLNGILDRETSDNYKLIIQVSDSGSPRLTGTGTIVVNVLDMNDNAPQFEETYYSATVEENQAEGTSVAVVRATDADFGKNSLIKYFIKNDDQQSLLPFSIDEDTGIVKTKTALDRESQSEWNITVTARDQAEGVPLEGRASVIIKVKDQNDNVPFIRNIRPDVFLKTPAQGEFVYAVDAVDEDEGDNGRLTFVLSGKDAEFFTIDAKTGIITAKQSSLTSDSYTIDVTISDNGKPPLQTSISYRLYFRTSTDFPSFAILSNESFSIAENKKDTVISTISARSPKQAPFNRIIYGIAAGNLNSAFIVDPDSGTLSSTSGLDFEKYSEYQLWISASDNDNPTLTSFFKVPIKVIDINDNAPKFSHSVYKVRVLEEEEPPIHVAKVEAMDADSGKNGRLNYFLESHLDYFEIDKNNGVISTIIQIDREKISKFELVVFAKDQGEPSLSSSSIVIVDVDDINDNAPKFTRLFSASIPEDAEIGDFVTQVTSSDADSTENSNNTYYFGTNPSGKFSIDPFSGNVSVNGPLDRETTPEYSLKVVAVDGAWRVETSLSISLIDVNDNAPNFTSPIYMFNVSEFQSPFTKFGAVKANDRDASGLNSKIWYRLKETSSLFNIDAVTGELSTSKMLYYRKNNFGLNFHQLTVFAQDYGKPSLSSSTLVVIRIMEINLHSPLFEKSFYKFAAPLSLSPNTYLGRVRATDILDSGLNSLINYKTEEKSNFTVDSDSGVIRTRTSLSSSSGQEYHLSIIAYDNGSPSLSAVTEVTIISAGPNQNAPHFTSKSYSASLAEDSNPGTVVLTVQARDADDGINGEVKYVLENSTILTKIFNVNESTGVLSLVGLMDYEKIKEFNFRIFAIDAGYESKNSSAIVTVTVQDVDDNPPIFSSSNFECSIVENVPSGHFICQLNATDADGPPYNSIFYSFCNGSLDQDFTLNFEFGKIYTKSSIDYETRQIYRYTVCATNKNMSLVDQANLTIYVENVNEFLPKFDKKEFEVFIPDNTLPGSSYPGVQATDQDYGADGVVYYFTQNFSNGANNAFSVDRLTGSLIVKKKLDPKIYSQTKLVVGAKNRHVNSLEDINFAELIVNIKSGSAASPIFAKKQYSVQVAENSIIGTSVLSVSAKGEVGKIFYDIKNTSAGYETFSIDNKSGSITVKNNIDRESLDHYNLTLFVSNGEQNSLVDICFVNISVLDVNDNSPFLRPSRSRGYILEGDPIGTNITVLLPEDIDLPPNGSPFNFSLIYDSEESYSFELDASTGVLKNKIVFDREKREVYNLRIVISDNGRPTQSSTVEYTVFINDVNDNPSFSKPIDVTVLLYNTNSFFGDIGAVKPADVDIVGDYQCTISMQTDNLFNIASGCILSSAKLSADKTYSITVNGTDGIHDWVSYNAAIKMDVVANETLSAGIMLEILSMKNYSPINIIADLNKFISNERRSLKLLSYIPSTAENEFYLFVSLLEGNNILSSDMSAKLLSSTSAKDISQKFVINDVIFGYCHSSPCKNGGVCADQVIVDKKRNFLEEDRKLYSFGTVRRVYTCQCAEGFTGSYCETKLDRCAFTRCQNGGTCIRSDDGKSTCTCPVGFEGTLCQTDIDECSNDKTPCNNGGYCENTNGSYKCICLIGFSGPNCLSSNDECASEPCFNGGRCTKLAGNGYKCICNFGYSGRNCEISSFGFGESAYLEVNPLIKMNNQLVFEFATIQENSLLLSFGSLDNMAFLDIVNRSLRFVVFATNVKPFELKLSKTVSDGKWYQVRLIVDSKGISLSVGSCPVEESVCQTCPTKDPSCSIQSAVNFEQTKFPIASGNLFIGSLKNFDDILMKPFRLVSYSFVGCTRNIVLNNQSIDDHGVIEKYNLLDYCPRSNEPPCQLKNSCRDGETCIDKWSHRMCNCAGGFSATNCEDASTASNFNGGYVSYKLTEAYRRKLLLKKLTEFKVIRAKRSARQFEHSVTFEFRTSARDGLMFFAASKEEFSLIDISNDTIRYMSKTSNSNPMQMYFNEDVSVTDGEWHTVTLKLFDDARTVELRVDNKVKEARSPYPVHIFLNPNLTSLSLGGTAEIVKVFNNELPTFAGCLRGFVIDGTLQPMKKDISDMFEVSANGDISNGCSGSLRCVSPPCSASPLPSTTFNAGVAAVIVFFGCLIVSTIVAYFIVKRVRNRKAATTRSTPEPKLDKLDSLNALNHSGINLSGSTKDSGIVIGDSREVLNRCESAASNVSYNNNFFGKPEPLPYISKPIVQPRMISAHNNSFGVEGFGFGPERYDLDNASSIAPSDTDVAYHYRGYREQSLRDEPIQKSFHHIQPPAIPSRVLKNGPSSAISSARQSPSSVKLKSSLRATPTSSNSSHFPKEKPLNSSTSEEEEGRPRRRSSAKNSRSKRRAASSPRKESSLKRTKKRTDPSSTTPLSSLTDMRRFRSNPNLSDDSSSGDADYQRQPSIIRKSNNGIPRSILSRPAHDDGSDSESAVCSELDLDTVRKPRHLLFPNMGISSSAVEETETESESVAGASRGSQLPVTLAAFRGGPRSMFPVSEDESDAIYSSVSNPNDPSRGGRNFLSRISNVNDTGKSAIPNLEAYV